MRKKKEIVKPNANALRLELAKKKHQEEAERHGLKIIEPRPKNPNYRLYQMPCGHQAELQVQHVRRGQISCPRCFDVKLEQAFAKKNATLIKRLPDCKSLVRHNSCGHEQERFNSCAFSKSALGCDICKKQTHLDFESEAGVICISDYNENNGKKGVFKVYQFIECGHQQVLNRACVARKAIECKTCWLEKIKKEAIETGLVLLRQNTKIAYGLYALPCGCEKELRYDHVRHDNWACEKHEVNRYSKPSGVYLMKITCENFSWLKFGIATQVYERASQYGLQEGSTVQQLFFKPFETGLQALRFEKLVHKNLKPIRLNPKQMRNFMKANGYTECYPVDKLEEVLQEILKNL